jgi:hypothetical protein
VEALKNNNKERQDETQFTTKIDGLKAPPGTQDAFVN